MLAVQWGHAVTGFGPQSTDDFFSRWMYLAIVVSAGLAVLSSGLRRRPIRKSWCAFGAGLISVAIGDVIYSLAKALIFAILVVLIHCYYGYYASGGPAGVGVAVGRAIRTSIVVINIVNLILSAIFWGAGETVRIAG